MASTSHPDFFRALWDSSPQSTLVYDAQGLCQFVSPGFLRFTSRAEDDYRGRDLATLWADVHPEDRVVAQQASDAWLQVPPGPSVPVLLRFRSRNGDWRLAEITAVNRLSDPQLQGLVLHWVLVVDRKRSEDLLLSERERLLVTLRSIGDGVIATNVEGQVTLINSVAEQLCGWTQAEAQGRSLLEVFRIVNEETGAPCENPVKNVFATGTIVGLANHTALISRQGRVSVIEDSAAPIRDSAGVIIGAVLVFRDVTVAKKMASELLKMQKLESIGMLAGGIAHDFNNILSAILGNASLAAAMVDTEHPVHELLLGIQAASRRASELTRQLLTFAKGGAPSLQSTKLAALVREEATFLLRGSPVTCDYQLAEDLHPVLADPGQLGQVLQNLVLNAVQAMGETGTLSIRAQNCILMAESGLPLVAGSYVRLEVADQGPGIEPHLVEKIFEPYFTTKQSGSGLGLSVVWSIVKSHHGWIQVESRLGVGTVFRIWLPADQGQHTPTAVVPKPAVSARGGRVLVMDDESEPRRTLALMLAHLGFEAVEAESGEKVLDLLESGERFHLAIVDLTVKGGLGGREILPRVKHVVPDLPVLVSSGYSADPVLADHRGFGFSGVLKKPFSLAELTLALDQALGS